MTTFANYLKRSVSIHVHMRMSGGWEGLSAHFANLLEQTKCSVVVVTNHRCVLPVGGWVVQAPLLKGQSQMALRVPVQDTGTHLGEDLL
jgi:hypothetical protein